jgi:MEDS: MEthanogen/methylotroph, DcmR Sensory domain
VAGLDRHVRCHVVPRAIRTCAVVVLSGDVTPARGHAGALTTTTVRIDTTGGYMQQGASAGAAGYHAVRFYDSDGALARIVAEFLTEGFDRASPAIVVATPILRAEIIRELRDRSLDVDGLQRSHDLLLLDAKETLSSFMANGRPDAGKFKDQMCQVIQRVCRDRADCTVRIFGQMVDVLWQNGERDAAIRLEMLWNQLAQTEAFSLLCGYAMGHFYKDAHFADICGQHSHIVSEDGKAERIA